MLHMLKLFKVLAQPERLE